MRLPETQIIFVGLTVAAAGYSPWKQMLMTASCQDHTTVRIAPLSTTVSSGQLIIPPVVI